MRIINQDGKDDFPYELCSISRVKNKIYVVFHDINQIFVASEYSSEEKAERAMEMCRETYLYTKSNGDVPPKIFMFPKDDEVDV